MKTISIKFFKPAGLIKRFYFLLLTFFVLSNYSFCQVPEKFNYQAVVRDQDGNLIANQKVSFRINILSGSAQGTPVYIETHIDSTNKLGLVTLEIGGGTVESGDFSIIDFGKYNYYMKVEMDKEGGTNYAEMGTTQLLSVPYALYAKDVENKDDADADPNNELINSATLNGTTLEISDAGGTRQVDLSPLATGSATDDQILSVSGHQLSIENGNTVTLPDETEDADADSTNEIQDLQLTGNTLKITGNTAATPLDLSTYLDNTDSQNLSLAGAILSIQNGNNVNLSAIGGGTDSQTLSLTGNTLGITNGNNIDLSKYLDNTDNQGLSLSEDILSIENGTGSVNLANYRNDADADTTNEIQDLKLTGNILSITNNGAATPVDLGTYLDNTDSQTLSLAGATLSILNGNNVDLSGIGGGTDSQTLSLTNNTLAISNGNSLDLSKYESNWSTISGGIGYNLGNVGIGTTNPSQKLEINGSIKGNSFIGDGSSLTNIDYNQLINRPNFSGWDQNASDDFSGNYNDLTNKPGLSTILATGNSVGSYSINMNGRDLNSVDDIYLQSGSVVLMDNASKILFNNENGTNVGSLEGSIGGYDEFHCTLYNSAQMVWLDESSNWLMIIQDKGSTGDLLISGNLNVSGTKNFVMSHPDDPKKEIVYSCLEGGEAGVYIRGEARLINGKATVKLAEHFSFVALDKALMVNVTPAGDCSGLYVESVTNKELKVRELSNGTSNIEFYYVVYGFRKGYDDFQVIRDKENVSK